MNLSHDTCCKSNFYKHFHFFHSQSPFLIFLIKDFPILFKIKFLSHDMYPSKMREGVKNFGSENLDFGGGLCHQEGLFFQGEMGSENFWEDEKLHNQSI